MFPKVLLLIFFQCYMNTSQIIKVLLEYYYYYYIIVTVLLANIIQTNFNRFLFLLIIKVFFHNYIINVTFYYIYNVK